MSENSVFFEQLKFKWPWRDYQSRVLGAIDQHLEDDKLHIVAAPGAGKTVLGLEVFRQLGLPTLVLSPARIIRNQWLNRLQDFSSDQPLLAENTSLDIHSPSVLTSITYQSLHSQYKNQQEPDTELEDDVLATLSREEVNQLVDIIKSAKIGVLILDEAHHLTAKWWKAIDYVLNKIPSLKLVSLTATPPYDVNGNEWLRYQSLCGVIDEEISAPELVKSGTLSPHQDFIWVTKPDQKDDETTRQYDRAVHAVEMQLFNDDQFISQVIAHRLMNNDAMIVEDILQHPELAVAMLVLLKAKSIALPDNVLKLFHIQQATVPELSRRWWQVLVKSYLFDKNWSDTDANSQHRKQLARQLRKQNLLHSRELRLYESRLIKSQLTLSASKIQACVDIHRHERELRSGSLRQVILADFIRADDIDEAVPAEKVLGAWPIYRQLVEQSGADGAEDCCLLTGQLCVVHKSRLEQMIALSGMSEIESQPLSSLTGYYRLKLKSATAVDIVTRLFIKGDFHVIVGTRSLLGEGWDAPCINSLLLASFVGSFVLTNQMRGRAIRSDKNDKNKMASIWHLVCITKTSYSGIADLNELQRRFKTFVGLSANGRSIENGLDRMKLIFMEDGDFKPIAFSVSRSNRGMVRRLHKHAKMAEDWKTVVDKTDGHRIAPVVRTAERAEFRGYHFRQTLKYFLLESVAGAVAVAGTFFPDIFFSSLMQNSVAVVRWVVISFAAGFIWLLPRLFKSAKLLLKHLPVTGSLQHMSQVLTYALCETGEFGERPENIAVNVMHNQDGSFDINISGVSFYHQSLFADCLDELLTEIENPRYIITRSQSGLLGKRVDYHAVPRVFATHKKRAAIFHKHWERRFGQSSLIYTRTQDGRIDLLRARVRAFSTQIKCAAERLDVWQ